MNRVIRYDVCTLKDANMQNATFSAMKQFDVVVLNIQATKELTKLTICNNELIKDFIHL